MNSRAIRQIFCRTTGLVIVLTILVSTSSLLRADTGTCGGATITLPFTDVMSSPFFCQIAEAYLSGLTNGTTATTYNPGDLVTREQMAAFVTRTMDQSVRRSSRRAALNQYWTKQATENLTMTSVGIPARAAQSDGRDVWVACFDTVARIRASDGKLIDTWTGANSASAVLCAMGKVFITGDTAPGKLYEIDPTQPAGAVTTLTNNLGNHPTGIAYDGSKIWTANNGGSVSIVTTNPIGVTTQVAGLHEAKGIVYDGSNMWVTDNIAGSVDKLRKLDSNGNVLLSVDVGDFPRYPAFDGTNIWVPNYTSQTVSVVRATGGLAGTVLATLPKQGSDLALFYQAAFDGERVLVTSDIGASVSLWKATDLTPLGEISTGDISLGACSDGTDFWVVLLAGKVLRF